MIVKEPRNMHLSQVFAFLRHCYERQVSQGPESAFRFAKILSKGRPKIRIEATYPEERPFSPEKRPSRHKEKRKDVGQLEGLLQIPPENPPNADRQPSTEPGVAAAGSAMSSDLISVSMSQMLRLKTMGCSDIFGPINGPNEGLPKYQVPLHWLRCLGDAADQNPEPDRIAGYSMLHHNSDTQPTSVNEVSTSLYEPVIDPSLVTNTQIENSDVGTIYAAAPEVEPAAAQTRPYPRPRPTAKAKTIIPIPHAESVVEQCPTVNRHTETDAQEIQSAAGNFQPANEVVIAVQPTSIESTSPETQEQINPAPLRPVPAKEKRNTMRKVTTADALALEEAERFMTTSKRKGRPQKRQG